MLAQDHKIKVHKKINDVLIWSSEDMGVLREQYRIVGRAIGCLPSAPLQNNHFSLPILLMPQEVRLLLDLDVIEIVEDVDVSSTPDDKLLYNQIVTESLTQQKEMYTEKKRQERESKREEIINGIRQKRLQQIQLQESRGISVSDEQKQAAYDIMLPEVSGDQMTPGSEFIQLHTVSPWQHSSTKPAHFFYPHTDTERKRYAVYRELWCKGFWLTDGTKFGSLYLVYPGDPLRYHAHMAAVITESMTSFPLLGTTRALNGANKSLLVSVGNSSSTDDCAAATSRQDLDSVYVLLKPFTERDLHDRTAPNTHSLEIG